MSAARPAKPPVVMIHGAFCGPWAMEGFAAAFTKAGYKVTTPALRFHDGKRPPVALATTSLKDYVADLEAVIGALDAPPILVAHSMGGLVAQMLAARREIRAAILLAPSAPWGVPPSTLFEIGAAQSMFLQPGFWSSILVPSRDIAFAHSLDMFPRATRDAVFDRFVPESGRAMFEVMHWGIDMNRGSEVDAARVICPLLVLVGSEDRINPPATATRIAGLYENAELEIVDGMGHWLVGEPGWEKLAARALAWAKGISGRTASSL